jgi:hypothetical protein
MAPIAGPFPPQLCFLSEGGSSLPRPSCGDGPGPRPQKAMARKSVPSVDSRSDHPQMTPIAGPFPPQLCFLSEGGSSPPRPSCGDGPGPRPQEAMARKSVPSVDSRSHHPQMAPIAGPFPPRPGFSPKEARRRPDRRAATGQGHAYKKQWPGNRPHLWTADLIIHRWHRLPAHSRHGLVSPRRRLVAAQTVVRRRARATPTRSNGPEIGAFCGQQKQARRPSREPPRSVHHVNRGTEEPRNTAASRKSSVAAIREQA